MKKALAMILTAILALSLISCNNNSTTLKETDNNDTTVKADGTNIEAPDSNGKNDSDLSSSATPESPDILGESEGELITRERAIELALEKAGLSADAVFDMDAELERERGNVYWEVDFDTREYEYSYVIDAVSGEIVHEEQDFND